MPRTMRRKSMAGRLRRTVLHELAAAIDQSLGWHRDAITPRAYVELRTMSPFELGLRFKRALRDELYERRRDDRRGTPARKSEKGK